MKQKILAFKKQAGMTLVELMIVLAIAAFVIGGAIALMKTVQSSSEEQRLATDMMSIRSIVKTKYLGQGTYGTGNISQLIYNSQKYPTTLTWSATNSNFTTYNGGSVTVTGNGANFSVVLTNVPQASCADLLSASSGWTSIQVGGSAAITTFPISPTVADTACGTGTNPTFTFVGQ